MAKVICPGEVLIDFISLENGKKLVDVEKFQKKAGGRQQTLQLLL